MENEEYFLVQMINLSDQVDVKKQLCSAKELEPGKLIQDKDWLVRIELERKFLMQMILGR